MPTCDDMREEGVKNRGKTADVFYIRPPTYLLQVPHVGSIFSKTLSPPQIYKGKYPLEMLKIPPMTFIAQHVTCDMSLGG